MGRLAEVRDDGSRPAREEPARAVS
jgi:hypothetical protein